MEKVEIYLNVGKHKYKDNLDRSYISTTTLIEEYEHLFDSYGISKSCAAIGNNPEHPDYLKYKGLTAEEIRKNWEKDAIKGQERGNKDHDYLDNSIKVANGFNIKSSILGDSVKLYTVADIFDNNSFGILDLHVLEEEGIEERFPKIYQILSRFVKAGWKIYSEICTFHPLFLISGLIDVLLVKDKNFVVLDWKTNKSDIVNVSGYFKKDKDGELTTEFIETNKTFKYPLSYLPESTSNKYGLQVSTYAYLTEQFGFTCVGIVLCHIRHENYTIDNCEDISWIDKQRVDKLIIPYMKKDVKKMITHYNKINLGASRKSTSNSIKKNKNVITSVSWK